MVHLGLHRNSDCEYTSVSCDAKESSNDDSVEIPSPKEHDKSIDFRDFQTILVKLEARIQDLKNETVDRLKSLEQEVKLNNQEEDVSYSVVKDLYEEEMQCKFVQPSSESLEENCVSNQMLALIFLCIWGFFGVVVLSAYFGSGF